MIKPCNLILADELTGSLDNENKILILDLLDYLIEQGKTLLIVTHDRELAQQAHRRISMEMIS